MTTANVLVFGGQRPVVHAAAWVAPTAMVIGDVTIAEDASVFYGAVVRGDTASITVGAGSNLQDLVAVHADPGFPVRIGAGVSVGHGAVIHGCTVKDGALIGMGAVVLNGAIVGAGTLVAAGAVVLGGSVIPPGCLVAGTPGKVRRELSAKERAELVDNGVHYVALARAHRDELGG